VEAGRAAAAGSKDAQVQAIPAAAAEMLQEPRSAAGVAGAAAAAGGDDTVCCVGVQLSACWQVPGCSMGAVPCCCWCLQAATHMPGLAAALLLS
jgi:hypothetical protein